ncbi:methyl-accepting chemotaxis protein [Cohnella rhizosphaerae]|uniref:Methyl-accepting chemotaxis protein n=1 Tax=Cohnella rhizosphaerae TaxID=1457232 RepID=A0A9X4QTP1_9BACL|nr:methyl-accepting chemotaxis protein [Cohnella rhizosphaerae]MDG0811376.1 methyl-accepting chemotaxis protein [Cohnella rhizosphaerae]
MNFTIRKKLMAGFLGVIILLGMISAISYVQLLHIDNAYSDLVGRRTAILIQAKEIQNYASRENGSLRGALLQEEGASDTLAEMIAGLDGAIRSASDLAQRAETKDTLSQLASLNGEFKQEADKVLALLRTDPTAAKEQFVEKTSPIAVQIRDLADRIVESQSSSMDEGSKENSKLVDDVIRTVLTLSAISLILAVGIALLISRVIARPILALADGAERIASGDLTQPDIRAKNRDEIARLATAFNLMKAKLRQLIGEVGMNTGQVAATSEELAASAEQTSRATEQISAAIQEVAEGSSVQVSSVTAAAEAADEISKGMAQAAASIQRVAALNTDANEKADDGHQVVSRAIEQMERIGNAVTEASEVVYALSGKSKAIKQIAETIAGLSAQTNILSLNAAIEATRAGEHGLGFAVVAREVRRLAEQSSEAAGQVQELVLEIQKEADTAVGSMDAGASVVIEGIELVNRSGTSFSLISGAVEQAAAESQAVASIVEQVNASAQRMLQMMENVAHIAEQSAANMQNVAASSEEQNAAMEEVSASAEALSQMAQELQEAIGHFKV